MRWLQAIVLAPTRELAIQSYQVGCQMPQYQILHFHAMHRSANEPQQANGFWLLSPLAMLDSHPMCSLTSWPCPPKQTRT